MPNRPMDAESSFAYLNEQLPVWLAQLNELSKYAAAKSEEFEADESLLVNEPTAKRFKSTSLQSLESSGSPAAESDPSGLQPDCSSCTTPPPGQNGSASAFSDGQRKRKRTQAVRSTELCPLQPPRRQKKVVQYDSHVQVQLDCMVKDIGIARNNLRKARNAHQATRGFTLPPLKRKASSGPISSLEDGGPRGKQQGMLAIAKAKQVMSHPTPESDMALFFSADKQLETVQDLYETAAYQFLRNGECMTQLDSAKIRLDGLVVEAVESLNTFREKVTKESTEDQSSSDLGEATKKDTSDSNPQRCSPARAFHPPNTVHNKFGPTRLCQTLEEMNQRPVINQSLPIDLSHLAAASPVIEVNDDESDEESISELDMSRFRASNMARVARAY
ncbi:hypothetical protein DV738_g4234, partial [Chaetothyriales sp. CBS 135597]